MPATRAIPESSLARAGLRLEAFQEVAGFMMERAP